MKIAWQLRRNHHAEAANAILLPSGSSADLLAVHAQLEPSQSPAIYATKLGLLVTLSHPSTLYFADAIRLRAVAENFLIPVDAELTPALHPEEAAGMVRTYGLLFLPHHEPVTFAPDSPLPIARFLAVPEARRKSWAPFPQKRAWATRIESIVFERRDDPDIDILEPGGEGIGDEASLPEAPALPYRVIAWICVILFSLLFVYSVFLITRMLGQLGTPEGLSSIVGLLLLALGICLLAIFLAKPAGRLLRRGVAAMPKVSQSIIRQQDAALRALLHRFQAGKTEEALRRALPLSSFGPRGSSVATNAQLPTNDLVYSLRKFFGGGSGRSAVWAGGVDSRAQLESEYRKAAAQAAARGDHRRAAYIYGKLLADIRAAANVLRQGGLFHDAAILFLKVLGDPRAAAAAFEAGGEFDAALGLYISLGDHLRAAELLRRTGDEEGALPLFEQAAQDIVSQRSDYLAAGDLMRTKAGRADLAQKYFEAGWALRPGKNDVACALALARGFLAQEALCRLRQLLEEGEETLSFLGREKEAADFFNEIAKLAATLKLPPARDELRDRCLMNLAGLLRHRLGHEMRPGKLVYSLLGASWTWDAAQVSDADFAWKAEVRKREVKAEPRPRTPNRLRFETGKVTAVCSAPGSGRLFIGFESGAIGCFDPASSRWLDFEAANNSCPVAGLATTMAGDCVVARFDPLHSTDLLLRGNPRGGRNVLTVSALQPMLDSAALRSYVPGSSTSFRLEAELSWQDPETVMAPLLVHYYGAPLCLLVSAAQLMKFDANNLVCMSQTDIPAEIEDCQELMFLPVTLHDLSFPIALTREGRKLCWFSAVNRPGEPRTAELGWAPAGIEGTTLQNRSLSWLPQNGRLLCVAGASGGGDPNYSEVDLTSSHQVRTARLPGFIGPCLAVCVAQPGLLAAIAPKRLLWLRTRFPTFQVERSIEGEFEGAIGCFASPRTDEILIVFQDGEIGRVAIPS
jgi:tetratricopeptide (TPR) repeat protein